jgi:hypothetical protein
MNLRISNLGLNELRVQGNEFRVKKVRFRVMSLGLMNKAHKFLVRGITVHSYAVLDVKYRV